jgi:thiosulfate reductase cytochrome b subunit
MIKVTVTCDNSKYTRLTKKKHSLGCRQYIPSFWREIPLSSLLHSRTTVVVTVTFIMQLCYSFIIWRNISRFKSVKFICYNLQMIYDQSFCYLCVGAGNLCLHGICSSHMVIRFLLDKLWLIYLNYSTQHEWQNDTPFN